MNKYILEVTKLASVIKYVLSSGTPPKSITQAKESSKPTMSSRGVLE